MVLMASSHTSSSSRGPRWPALLPLLLALLAATSTRLQSIDAAPVAALVSTINSPFPVYAGVNFALPNGAGLLQVAGLAKSGGQSFVSGGVWHSTDDGETWNELAVTAPFTARYSHWGVVFNDGAILIGGGKLSKFNGDVADDLWTSSSPYTVWTQVSHTGMVVAHEEATVALVGSTLVVAGGWDAQKNFIDAVYRSHDKGVTWTLGASLPSARAQHAAVALDDDRMMLGFGKGNAGSTVDHVYIYSVSANSWSTVTVTTPVATVHPLANGMALLPSGTIVYQSFFDLWYSKDEGANWASLPNGESIGSQHGSTPMWTDSGLVFMSVISDTRLVKRIHCSDASRELDADLLCVVPPAMNDCTAAATTQILELAISASSTAITTDLVSGANSPGRTFTSAVLRVPTTGGDCDHDILSALTCNNDCVCTLDISATDLAGSCTVDDSSGSFTATFIVGYEDAQANVWGKAVDPVTYTVEAATSILSGSQDITAAIGTATARVVGLQLNSNVIAPAADEASDATMTINFKLVSATEVTGVAASNPVMVDGTAGDTSDDLSSIAVVANGAADCGGATCSHNFVLTLDSLATICNFDGTVTLDFAPTCSGGECDTSADAFTATITIAQPFNSKDICLPAAGAAASLEQSLTTTTAAALVTSASTAANLVWESFVHETGDTDAKQISDLTSIKMGLYDASTDTCDASLATLQQVHDGTAITQVGTDLESLTFDTPTNDATHTVTMGLTLDNVGNLAELGIAGADETRKTAFQTNYRTLICTVVVRTVSGGFGSGRRLTVTTASSSEVKAGAAGGEVVAFLPPAQAAAGNYMVDSATTVAFRFTTGDADLLEEPAIREHIRNAVSASLAHAAGMSASQIVVTGMELVEGADGNHHVHVTTALVLRGSDAAIVAQHESATTNLAASSSLGDSIELKLSEVGVNNMQHASTSVSRDAPLPGAAPDANATSGNMNLFIIGGVGVAAIALIALVAVVVVRARGGAGNAVTKIQPELPCTDVIVTTGHAASINGSNRSAWSDAA